MSEVVVMGEIVQPTDPNAWQADTVQVTWTETRTFSAVVVTTRTLTDLCIQHAPGLLAETLNTMLEDNADDEALRPVFLALAKGAVEGDVEVTEVCDASVEY